ncbi:hypothetical protein ETH_00026100 [Eimeria tenella]|uniref:Uncharacterized protein n=1 Tax=Eimeria tenella TaxID=5802 RepID=U6KU80_EIMTE|nr:hypothetical protein ETH_00026100 [Eimeria tenella]CDJ41717.1 hypothetical protein ETH_00026100 [Eimeria tenella]|eukprot:XP_013232467.1 hypothetical protein ETH_00026100 [Eimeria tenella]
MTRICQATWLLQIRLIQAAFPAHVLQTISNKRPRFPYSGRTAQTRCTAHHTLRPSTCDVAFPLSCANPAHQQTLPTTETPESLSSHRQLALPLLRYGRIRSASLQLSGEALARSTHAGSKCNDVATMENCQATWPLLILQIQAGFLTHALQPACNEPSRFPYANRQQETPVSPRKALQSRLDSVHALMLPCQGRRQNDQPDPTK